MNFFIFAQHNFKNFTRLLFQHNSGKKLYHHEEKIQFETDSEWVNIIRPQYAWHNKVGSKKPSTIYLAMELSRESDSLTIDTINLENKDWLFVCTSSKAENQRIW